MEPVDNEEFDTQNEPIVHEPAQTTEKRSAMEQHPSYSEPELTIDTNEDPPELMGPGDYIFIDKMIRAVVAGSYGEGDDIEINLEAAGFKEANIYDLMLAVEERVARDG